ncbi:MAG: hypothetical protein HYY49_00195 [Ignavibacteriales bacterium]|nr:hypothetical protein [Ignavibacteriales bacterium]
MAHGLPIFARLSELYSMRKLLLFVAFALPAGNAFSQFIQARFVTSGYAWQQQDTVGQSSGHFFGYQTVQFTAAADNIAFSTYWQGYNDFAGPLKGKGQYRLYNLYARATNIFEMLDVSLGRQFVFAGVGSGTIDGGRAALKLFDSQLKVVGYYGSLPPPLQKAEFISDPENNYMTGAQVVAMPADEAQISLSYMKRAIQPSVYTATRRDSLFNPYLVEIKPSAREEEYVSGDVNVDYEDWLSAYWRYDYDLVFDKNSRIQLFTRLKATDYVNLTGEFLRREPRISFNSIFSAFTFNTLKEYEFGFELALPDQPQFFLRFGYLSYDDEDVRTITVGANSKYAGLSVSTRAGYPGEITSGSMNLGYPVFDNTFTPTLMLGYARYKLNENSPLEGALSLGLGTVYRPATELSVDTQVQWIQNKIYRNDTRLFVRLSYFFLQRLDLL